MERGKTIELDNDTAFILKNLAKYKQVSMKVFITQLIKKYVKSNKEELKNIIDSSLIDQFISRLL